MNENTRPRGVTVYPMPESVTGESDSYALAVRISGAGIELRMVHSEGVAYVVSEERPWTWNDYGPCESFTPAELIALVDTFGAVDLADWVRTFGARLESNFSQIYAWANQS